MITNSKTSYKRDHLRHQILVERYFDAPVEQVWKAWTDDELLDLWWAPKPWKTNTRVMDFTEGGYWMYSMNGPQGEQHFARADYIRIVPRQNMIFTDAFCDEDGVISLEVPPFRWEVDFDETTTGTLVQVIITSTNAEGLDKLLQMGFLEGFSAAHENLDELLQQTDQLFD